MEMTSHQRNNLYWSRGPITVSRLSFILSGIMAKRKKHALYCHEFGIFISSWNQQLLPVTHNLCTNGCHKTQITHMLSFVKFTGQSDFLGHAMITTLNLYYHELCHVLNQHAMFRPCLHRFFYQYLQQKIIDSSVNILEKKTPHLDEQFERIIILKFVIQIDQILTEISKFPEKKLNQIPDNQKLNYFSGNVLAHWGEHSEKNHHFKKICPI